MTVYAYTRVSTDRQASEGESLAVQERTVGGYAQMHGWAIDRTFVESGVSGSVPLGERPEGRSLLTMVEAGDIIVSVKLDRVFRSASDALNCLEKLKGKGVHLHLIDLGGDVTGNGIAKLVFTILSAVAEAERDRIRERIAVVKADQRRRGRYLGGSVPFGYSLDAQGDLVENQETMGTVFRLRAEGLSLRAIAAKFNGKVSHVAVGNILRKRHAATCQVIQSL
jgi:DNA invertase Pin-like site-specific DNA recombinase